MNSASAAPVQSPLRIAQHYVHITHTKHVIEPNMEIHGLGTIEGGERDPESAR